MFLYSMVIFPPSPLRQCSKTNFPRTAAVDAAVPRYHGMCHDYELQTYNFVYVWSCRPGLATAGTNTTTGTGRHSIHPPNEEIFKSQKREHVSLYDVSGTNDKPIRISLIRRMCVS